MMESQVILPKPIPLLTWLLTAPETKQIGELIGNDDPQNRCGALNTYSCEYVDRIDHLRQWMFKKQLLRKFLRMNDAICVIFSAFDVDWVNVSEYGWLVFR